jgi:zinc D-Ala-D-Ala carboxypeptidase
MTPTHFALEEFLVSDTADAIGVDNFPSWQVVDNLKRLGETMERIREILGGLPVTVLSGYRSPPVNEAVGGAENSAHLFGLACDFVCPDFGTPLDICHDLESYLDVLMIDQLINEMPPDGWVHVGLSDGPARHQCLTVTNTGTTEGF